MTELFKGEFLFHPIPFEMSMNACSHSCVYCFANLRRSDRKFDIARFINWAKKIPVSDSFTERKLREGYPILLSNLTDPFSKNNAPFSETVLEYFQRYGVRVYFQTKGGERAYDLIRAYGKPSSVYITMTSDRDDISARIEPGAPPVSERIEIAERLIADGHEVVVGINPLASEWMEEERLCGFVERLRKIGVRTYVLQLLYTSKKYDALYKKRDFAGADIEAYAKGKYAQDRIRYFQRSVLRLTAQGYNIIAWNAPVVNAGWEDTARIYDGKLLPTTQDFINHIAKGREKEEFDVSFQDFYDYAKPMLAEFFDYGYPRLDAYILTRKRDTWKKLPVQKVYSIETLLRYFWHREFKMNISPSYNLLLKADSSEGRLHYNAGNFSVLT